MPPGTQRRRAVWVGRDGSTTQLCVAMAKAANSLDSTTRPDNTFPCGTAILFGVASVCVAMISTNCIKRVLVLRSRAMVSEDPDPHLSVLHLLLHQGGHHSI